LGSAAATGAVDAAATGSTADFFATFAGTADLEGLGVEGIIPEDEEVLDDILRSSTGIIVEPGLEFFLLRTKNKNKTPYFLLKTLFFFEKCGGTIDNVI
jgi:hypothetical protein